MQMLKVYCGAFCNVFMDIFGKNSGEVLASIGVYGLRDAERNQQNDTHT